MIYQILLQPNGTYGVIPKITCFKLGPALLLNGLEAYIFQISDKIYGKSRLDSGHWVADYWQLDGTSHFSEEDTLLPNALNE